MKVLVTYTRSETQKNEILPNIGHLIMLTNPDNRK